MPRRLLLLESSKLYSASLKSRLETLGVEVAILTTKEELEAQIDSDFEMAITDFSFPHCPESEHFQLLKLKKKPVWLWSDHAELLADSERQAELGIEKSFRKLNRADLIHQLEAFFKKTSASLETPKKFLLVEDSATVRAYVRRVLLDRFPSSEIIEAEDGKTAIAAMKNSRIDLIVTDLQMPGMDGASFVHTLRANATLSRKPIVILSGMITAKVREEMASLPRLRFLPKPASLDALEEAARTLMNAEGSI